MAESLDESINELITTYHELNPSVIDELYEEPSPLEFMRYVARNRPFVYRQGAADWPACRKWNVSYLCRVIGEEQVKVAMTPDGRADAPATIPASGSNAVAFVKPHEESAPFCAAVQAIRRQEHDDADPDCVRYIQTQNDNLRTECVRLFSDLPNDVPFARIALRSAPDAVNFWLGNSRSVSALHKDAYENLFVQVVGQKHFVLLPPVEAACVGEMPLPSAHWERLRADGDGAARWRVALDSYDEPIPTVPFATWDPDEPDERATAFSGLARPMRVTLDGGDMLYLPALWYHKVSQSCSSEGVCVAVNYWTDMDMAGASWASAAFVRNAALCAADSAAAARGNLRPIVFDALLGEFDALSVRS